MANFFKNHGDFSGSCRILLQNQYIQKADKARTREESLVEKLSGNIGRSTRDGFKSAVVDKANPISLKNLEIKELAAKGLETGGIHGMNKARLARMEESRRIRMRNKSAENQGWDIASGEAAKNNVINAKKKAEKSLKSKGWVIG